MSRKLIGREESVTSDVQHTVPCSDCPFRRDSLRGWLGGHTADEYRKMAHADVEIKCHVIRNQQCAGAAIYRRNVIKFVDPPLLRLDADRTTVFATPIEFLDHHKIG